MKKIRSPMTSMAGGKANAYLAQLDQLSLGRRYVPRAYGDDLNLANNVLVHSLPALIFTQFVQQGISFQTGYPVLDDLRRHLADYFGISPAELLIQPGSDIALRDVLHSVARHAAALINVYPGYLGVETYAAQVSLPIIRVHLDDLSPEETGLHHAIVDNPDSVVVIADPNPAHGKVMSPASIDALVRLCAQHRCLLIIDRAYSAYADEPFPKCYVEDEHVIVVQSFSKSHGFAGLRAAVLIANEASIAAISTLNTETAVSSITAQFLLGCLQKEADFALARSEIKRNRHRIGLALCSKLRHVSESQGNFSAGKADNPKAASDLAAHLQEQGIVVRQLGTMWPEYKDWVRITACETHLASRVVEAINKF